jgi:hypothetical protein
MDSRALANAQVSIEQRPVKDEKIGMFHRWHHYRMQLPAQICYNLPRGFFLDEEESSNLIKMFCILILALTGGRNLWLR